MNDTSLMEAEEERLKEKIFFTNKDLKQNRKGILTESQ